MKSYPSYLKAPCIPVQVCVGIRPIGAILPRRRVIGLFVFADMTERIKAVGPIFFLAWSYVGRHCQSHDRARLWSTATLDTCPPPQHMLDTDV